MRRRINNREVIFEKTETGYSAYAPDLPGCVAAGTTVEETEELMRGAIEMHLDKAQERLCLFCEHFYLDTGCRDYSEYTPGNEFDMQCLKEHWTYKRYGDEDHYRACIIAAWKCPDYKLNAELIPEIEKAKA